jgi:hypothetical protein
MRLSGADEARPKRTRAEQKAVVLKASDDAQRFNEGCKDEDDGDESLSVKETASSEVEVEVNDDEDDDEDWEDEDEDEDDDDAEEALLGDPGSDMEDNVSDDKQVTEEALVESAMALKKDLELASRHSRSLSRHHARQRQILLRAVSSPLQIV